jgi:hypothetical protein
VEHRISSCRISFAQGPGRLICKILIGRAKPLPQQINGGMDRKFAIFHQSVQIGETGL